jgi:hypothetical protein
MQQWHKIPSLKQQLHLGSKGNINEALRQTIDLEIVKPAAGSSFRLRNINVRQY